MYPFPKCKWCSGDGCLACETESAKWEAKQPEPIFSGDPNNENDMRLMNQYLGREALEHAFGPDGEGMHEIERNAAIASVLQAANFSPPPNGKDSNERTGQAHG